MAKHNSACVGVLLCCILLFVGTFAMASVPGSNYSMANPTMSISDTSSCVVGGNDCWKQISSGLGISASSSQMAVSEDGQAFAVGVDEKLYEHISGAWQLDSSAPPVALSVFL